MKTRGMEQAIGKTIEGFILKEAAYGTRGLNGQICIVFTDGTWLEFYSHDVPINSTGGLQDGGMKSARAYILDHFQEVTSVFRVPDGDVFVRNEYQSDDEPFPTD